MQLHSEEIRGVFLAGGSVIFTISDVIEFTRELTRRRPATGKYMNLDE